MCLLVACLGGRSVLEIHLFCSLLFNIDFDIRLVCEKTVIEKIGGSYSARGHIHRTKGYSLFESFFDT